MRDALQQTRNLQGVAGLIGYADTSRIPVKGVTIVGVKDDKLFVAGQIVPPFVPEP
jgi:branched-chain amino acid transport system substrate-binding protein